VGTCLVKDPKKRPSSEKLLKHPFFKHARSADYLARTILEGMPPLGDRFSDLKVLSLSLYSVLGVGGPVGVIWWVHVVFLPVLGVSQFLCLCAMCVCLVLVPYLLR
jgi:serine/threonine protein kinase